MPPASRPAPGEPAEPSPLQGAEAFRKTAPNGPATYLGWEAAGLSWLAAAQADGGAPVVDVIDVSPKTLTLRRLHTAPPTPAAAAEFGERLSRTHAAGSDAWGAPPEGWDGDGYFGPADNLLPLSLGSHDSWGAHLAIDRLAPITRVCRNAGTLPAATCALLDRVSARVLEGTFDTDDRPARIHGDLWSGNVMWTRGGATLIDPAAHGGHRECDLAMLALFGAPHLDRIVTAYEGVSPLADGWRERQALHQLYPLAVHAHLFGGGYAASVAAAARRYA